MKSLPAILLACLLLVSCSTGKKEDSAIRIDEFMTHLTAISHDSTEGRGPGTRGYDRAAGYAVDLFKKWGLQPAGDNGSYYQQIQFTEATRDESSFSGSLNTTSGKIALDPASNFTVRPLPLRAKTELKDVPIVFVGYGIDAPELGYNSYDGVDVKGKIVLNMAGAPDSFNNEAKAIYAFNKGGMAKAHGAIGTIQFFAPSRKQDFQFMRLNFMYSMMWNHPGGETSDNHPDLQLVARISDDLAFQLMSLAGIDITTLDDLLSDGQIIHADIPARLTASVNYPQRKFSSPNLVAMLPGNDPILKEEMIVMTAHLDHLGIRKIGQDSIYNGTLDNASGSAALLTLAHRLSEEKSNSRTIVFVLLNGEELGLLGSDYFARYPSVPREKIVANLNMDGIEGMVLGSKEFIAYGYPYSNLASSVDAVMNRTGNKQGDDPRLEEAFFVRSDQFSFVKQGIPAIWVVSGYAPVDSTKDAMAVHLLWDKERYHQPGDDLLQPIDKDGLLRELTVDYELTKELANRMDKISWVEGSYLHTKYVKK